MRGERAHGSHVLLDYTSFNPDIPQLGQVVLDILLSAAQSAGINVVHSHAHEFDGVVSPPGFAAAVLIDESHITAHCYADRGWLAIDVFTCGDHDPNDVADALHHSLELACPGLVLEARSQVDRFLHTGE